MKDFDVAIVHSSTDIPQVKALVDFLKGFGLRPWVDYEQILPGRVFVKEMVRGLLSSAAIAVIIGTRLGPWQSLEVFAALKRQAERGTPVIPVLLPGVQSVPDELLFLQSFSAVIFHSRLGETRTRKDLIRAILNARENRE